MYYSSTSSMQKISVYRRRFWYKYSQRQIFGSKGTRFFRLYVGSILVGDTFYLLETRFYCFALLLRILTFFCRVAHSFTIFVTLFLLSYTFVGFLPAIYRKLLHFAALFCCRMRFDRFFPTFFCFFFVGSLPHGFTIVVFCRVFCLRLSHCLPNVFCFHFRHVLFPLFLPAKHLSGVCRTHASGGIYYHTIESKGSVIYLGI